MILRYGIAAADGRFVEIVAAVPVDERQAIPDEPLGVAAARHGSFLSHAETRGAEGHFECKAVDLMNMLFIVFVSLIPAKNTL